MFLRSTFLLLVSLSTASVIPFMSTSQLSLTAQETQSLMPEVSYSLKRQSHGQGRGSGRRELLGAKPDQNSNLKFSV